jgi:hypothetical protein
MSDTIIVENLVEISSDDTKTVDGISFNIREVEFLGFLGPERGWKRHGHKSSYNSTATTKRQRKGRMVPECWT